MSFGNFGQLSAPLAIVNDNVANVAVAGAAAGLVPLEYDCITDATGLIEKTLTLPAGYWNVEGKVRLDVPNAASTFNFLQLQLLDDDGDVRATSSPLMGSVTNGANLTVDLFVTTLVPVEKGVEIELSLKVVAGGLSNAFAILGTDFNSLQAQRIFPVF